MTTHRSTKWLVLLTTLVIFGISTAFCLEKSSSTRKKQKQTTSARAPKRTPTASSARTTRQPAAASARATRTPTASSARATRPPAAPSARATRAKTDRTATRRTPTRSTRTARRPAAAEEEDAKPSAAKSWFADFGKQMAGQVVSAGMKMATTGIAATTEKDPAKRAEMMQKAGMEVGQGLAVGAAGAAAGASGMDEESAAGIAGMVKSASDVGLQAATTGKGPDAAAVAGLAQGGLALGANVGTKAASGDLIHKEGDGDADVVPAGDEAPGADAVGEVPGEEGEGLVAGAGAGAGADDDSDFEASGDELGAEAEGETPEEDLAVAG